MNTRKQLTYDRFIQREYAFERTPFQSEFEKFKSIQAGDVETVRNNFKAIRNSFEKGKGTLSKDPVRNIRYHMIISTAITARICVQGGMPHDDAYALSDIYITKADETTSYNEILDLFENMHIDYATRMQELRKENVISIHVRKCIDYIYEHMHEKITIETLAKHIDRNPSYLSKLFHKETGINIHEYLTGVRVETAQNMLRYSNHSYLEIAESLGFCSQSSFISTFRRIVGYTPKQYRDLFYEQEL